jgi:post-segregation antitoxin (ccd killing protein)
LWRRIVAEIPDELELDARDIVVLGNACDLADRCRELSKVIAEDGLVLHEPRGTRLHPAATELRMSELALVKHLGTLDLDVGAVSQTAVSRGARARAQKRWRDAGQSRRSEGAA